MQDLIDIYLNICIDESEGKTPRAQVQIRNISTIPVSLIHYRFNGVERSIAPYRLPPASQYSEAYYYIWLPENGIADYVSFSLYFMDSMKRVWRMDGFAEIKNGRWEVSSQQPVMQNRE